MTTSIDYELARMDLHEAILRYSEVAGKFIAKQQNNKLVRDQVIADLVGTRVFHQEEIAKIVGLSQGKISKIMREKCPAI